MEFFKGVHSADCNTSQLKRLVVLNQLPRLCASISNVTALSENAGDIYCIWGAFNIKREELRYGVRFSLLNCPHALAWSITLNEADHSITIHCTIDKTEQDAEFVASIHEFVDDWSTGITEALQ